MANKRYECGDSFFKLDMVTSAALGVPTTASSVDRLCHHYFPKPCALPLSFVVQVKTGAGPQETNLACVSPVEIRMAILRAVKRDLDDVGRAQAWKRHLLSCHFVYVVLDSDEDTWKYARQLREDISLNYATLRLSALQSVYELVHYRAVRERAHGSQAAKAVAEAYSTGVRRASGEPLTQSFVDSAMTIHGRMLCDERIASTLLLAEETFGLETPFNGVTKLQAIVSKAGSTEKITWAVEWLFHARERGEHNCSLRDLTGWPPSSPVAGKVLVAGKTGLLEILNCKHDLKEYLPEFLADYTDWSRPVHDLFLKALSSHAEYRKLCADTENVAHIARLVDWPDSAKLAFRAFEALLLLVFIYPLSCLLFLESWYPGLLT